MLIIFPLWCIASLAFFFGFSEAGCFTSPFCDAYPECSRNCLGGEQNNSISFYHSYGYNMTKICSTGDAEAPLANHYSDVFDCIAKNCTSADGQAAWNQLVDDCGRAGFVIDSQLKPNSYTTHTPTTVAVTSTSLTSGSTQSPTTTATTVSTSSISSTGALPTSSSASPSSPKSSPTNPSSSASGGLSQSAIAGITVGGLVFAGLGFLATICAGWLKPYQFLWFITCGKKGQKHKRR